MKAAALGARPATAWSTWLGTLALVALGAWSYRGTDIDLGVLLGGEAS